MPGGGRGGADSGCRRAQGARGRRVHGSDRVVELAHAGEPGRERDLRDRQRGGLQEHACGVRPLGPGEGDGTRPELGGELALHLPGAVSEPSGEPGDALPVHDSVADQTHRPPHDVRAHVPLGGAGDRVRAAAAAGPEAGAVRGGGCRVEPYVVLLGGDCRAAGAAVDAGGLDGEEELTVEPGVPAAHGGVPGVLVGHTVQFAVRGEWAAGGYRTPRFPPARSPSVFSVGPHHPSPSGV